MQTGKVDTIKLKKLILDQVSNQREDILVGPTIGEDSAVIDFGEWVLIISSDPITGVNQGMGSLAVNVACNDLAANGAEVIGIQQVLLFPPELKENEIKAIVKDINQAAQKLGIEILGGHTEITDLVKKPLVSCTAVGKARKDAYITSAGAKPGDDIVVTKWAGYEGTAILATDFESELLKQGVSADTLKKAQHFLEDISVIKEGEIGAKLKVNAMHDVTEGGLYGALCELAIASEVGFTIEADKIPLHPATKKITSCFNLNPYQLISSGMMLMISSESDKLLNELAKIGINAKKIGKITNEQKIVKTAQGILKLNQPPKDELWRFLEKK